MSSAETTPLAKVHEALWTMLEASSRFCTLVSSGCRLKTVSSSGEPRKGGAQYADFPAVLIEMTEGVTIDQFDNSSADIRRVFSIKVATGAKQADLALELAWVIFVAVSNWETTMDSVTWRSHRFVTHTRIIGNKDTLKERELTHRETGWTTVWDCEVRMNFATADIVDNQ